MWVLLGGSLQAAVTADGQGGGSKTFALWPLGSHGSACEEEKDKRESVPFRRLDMLICNVDHLHVGARVPGHLRDNYALVFFVA